MKSIHPLLILSFFALLLAGCSKDKSIMASDVANDNLLAGTWQVTYLMKDGIDHTTEFNDYKIEFADGGAVAAANSLLSVHGNWSVSEVQTTTSLSMNFQTAHDATEIFDEFAGTWVIETNSAAKMVLHHDDDYIYLERK